MKDYIDDLQERLRDTKYAERYLKAALEEGDEATFLVALRDVANARGLSQVASAAQLNREHVYRILSAKGNPRLTTIQALLQALGFQLAVTVVRRSEPGGKSRTQAKPRRAKPNLRAA